VTRSREEKENGERALGGRNIEAKSNEE